MQSFYIQNKNIINKTLVLSIYTLSFFVFFRYLFTFIAPIGFGFIISLIIRPLVNLFNKKCKLNDGIATFLSLIILILTLGLITGTAINRLIREGAGFYYNLPVIIYYTEFVFGELEILLNDLYQIVPDGMQQLLSDIIDTIIFSVATMVGDSFSNIGNTFIASAPRVMLGTIIGFISSYFFSRDRILIKKTISGLLSTTQKIKLKGIRAKIIGALGGYFKAQAIIMSLVATIGTIGHLILGTPYALFISVVIAIIDAVPVFGSGLFYWPWIIASLITGEYLRVAGLAVVYIATLFTRQILEPKILGKEIGIHPILTLASIYIGLRLFGVFGIILGPFFAVVFKAVLSDGDPQGKS